MELREEAARDKSGKRAGAALGVNIRWERLEDKRPLRRLVVTIQKKGGGSLHSARQKEWAEGVDS